MSSVFDFDVVSIDGQPQSLGVFRGHVMLVVNVASRCGFTPQYAELESLYQKHRSTGFAVLGFPCNQFGHQEPGDEAEIRQFCSATYGVSFPLFAKIEVNGPRTDPLYRFLKSSRPGLLGTRAIKWNFTKFLVDLNGQAVRRFAPNIKIARIEAALTPLLTSRAT